MALVALEDLSFTYPMSDHKALDGLSLTIERGAFITLMGATGSGKSTLLRLLKPELRQNGDLQGEIRYSIASPEGNREVRLDSGNIHPRMVGYVAQNPEEQIVTDKVWHELAFTLENLGAKREMIARRIAETAACFGLEDRMERETSTLSGGEKQLLNLAAVMTGDPELLLLDEPTAQLDPIAAARFIETVYRLNRETGVTVILCEHRAEELFGISDQIMILDGGRMIAYDTPRSVAGSIAADSPYAAFLPAAARLYHAVGGRGEIPLTVREGQRFLDRFGTAFRLTERGESDKNVAEAVSLRHISFRYERNGADILRDMDMTVYQGEVFALLGSNGAGKSTLASVVAGLRKQYCGSVKLFSKPLKDYKNGTLYQGCLSLLPQDVESVFLCETVGEELKDCEKAVERMPYDLKPLYDRHPYDLSGGERQLVALCKALATDPRLLILDEPSKGLDNGAKALLCEVIRRLKQDGVTVLLITHDVEFAALCADRCALFAQGRIAAVDTTRRFMSDNRFYTTAAARITRRCCEGAYTVTLAAEMLRQNGGA